MRISLRTLRAPVVGYGWVRVLPLIGAAGTLGLLHVPQVEPSWLDWTLVLVSAVLVIAGGRRPLSVCLAQSTLLIIAAALAPLGVGIVQILACIALAELAFRRPGRPTWCGVGVVTAASAVAYYPPYSLGANMLKVALDVGLPLLLGSYLRSQRELAWQAEQRAAEAERSRALTADAARTAERAAVARELHDVVAHHVSAIVLRVGVVRHVVPAADPRLGEALDDVHAIGSQALADLRMLVSILRDPGSVGKPGLLTPADLSSALDAVIDRTRQAGVAVHTDIDPAAVERLDSAHRHAVLRLVQEGLTNVLKHAGLHATARLAVSRDPVDGRVEIMISDDGGEPHPRGPAEPGHGLTVMRERVELLHGTLDAGPSGRGWTLRAALPEAEPADRVAT